MSAFPRCRRQTFASVWSILSSKDQPVYALLVAKNGPRLKESVEDPNAAAAPPNPAAPPKGAMSMMMTPGGRMRLKSDALTMSRLTDMLASQLDRPVIDATELTGKYDIVLDSSTRRPGRIPKSESFASAVTAKTRCVS